MLQHCCSIYSAFVDGPRPDTFLRKVEISLRSQRPGDK